MGLGCAVTLRRRLRSDTALGRLSTGLSDRDSVQPEPFLRKWHGAVDDYATSAVAAGTARRHSDRRHGIGGCAQVGTDLRVPWGVLLILTAMYVLFTTFRQAGLLGCVCALPSSSTALPWLLADAGVAFLDVRSYQDFDKRRVPAARHILPPTLQDRLGEVDRSKMVALCGSGYRASIAASLLKLNGFERVVNVPGSWTAWKAARLPVEQ